MNGLLTLALPTLFAGAPTVAELKAMKQQAADAGVSICMGYNKVRADLQVFDKSCTPKEELG